MYIVTDHRPEKAFVSSLLFYFFASCDMIVKSGQYLEIQSYTRQCIGSKSPEPKLSSRPTLCLWKQFTLIGAQCVPWCYQSKKPGLDVEERPAGADQLGSYYHLQMIPGFHTNRASKRQIWPPMWTWLSGSSKRHGLTSNLRIVFRNKTPKLVWLSRSSVRPSCSISV